VHLSVNAAVTRFGCVVLSGVELGIFDSL
jgi:hypothetical protein